MSDVKEIVQQTLREMLGEEADKLEPNMKLKDVFLDSLDMLEFKMRLEERLDIELKVDAFETVGTLREATPVSYTHLTLPTIYSV